MSTPPKLTRASSLEVQMLCNLHRLTADMEHARKRVLRAQINGLSKHRLALLAALEKRYHDVFDPVRSSDIRRRAAGARAFYRALAELFKTFRSILDEPGILDVQVSGLKDLSEGAAETTRLLAELQRQIDGLRAATEPNGRMSKLAEDILKAAKRPKKRP